MTLIQMQSLPASAEPTSATVVEVMETGGPQVCDDMSVEVALSVMTAAHTGRLLVCDQDGQCTGLVTQTELTAVRDSAASTDRVRLRDILGDPGASVSPVTAAAEAEHTMRSLRLRAVPVVDEQGRALGVLALSR
ncbi:MULTISPECIES: CBS domain-containing protein [unclassified Streptomyces]|uniref:CBS domain-containing protein n=1 Tax=unclassified Streptomyces TaxID=2593676 RepID=UPI0036E550B3